MNKWTFISQRTNCQAPKEVSQPGNETKTKEPGKLWSLTTALGTWQRWVSLNKLHRDFSNNWTWANPQWHLPLEVTRSLDDAEVEDLRSASRWSRLPSASQSRLSAFNQANYVPDKYRWERDTWIYFQGVAPPKRGAIHKNMKSRGCDCSGRVICHLSPVCVCFQLMCDDESSFLFWGKYDPLTPQTEATPRTGLWCFKPIISTQTHFHDKLFAKIYHKLFQSHIYSGALFWDDWHRRCSPWPPPTAPGAPDWTRALRMDDRRWFDF